MPTQLEDSILKTIKQLLGVEADYDVFDMDIIIHINSAFAQLHQLDAGPAEVFEIDDETANWSDFIQDRKQLNNVKTYVYLYVRLLFDPPQMGYLVGAIQEQLKELTFRINVAAEEGKYVTETQLFP